MRRETPLGAWIAAKTTDCYVCDHFHQIYGRYLDTFFDLYKKNEEFRALFEKSRGFCLPHFGDLIEAAEDKLTDDEKKEFYPKAFSMMQDNLEPAPKRSRPGLSRRTTTATRTRTGAPPPTASSAACRSAPAAIPPTRYSRQSSEHHVPPRRLLLFHGTAASDRHCRLLISNVMRRSRLLLSGRMHMEILFKKCGISN